MVSKDMVKNESTVIAFHERKNKPAPTTPKPIRPPALNGLPPTREQLRLTLRCADRYLMGDDMNEAMLMHRAVEAVSMVLRVSPAIDEKRLTELVVLRRFMDKLFNEIKAVGG